MLHCCPIYCPSPPHCPQESWLHVSTCLAFLVLTKPSGSPVHRRPRCLGHHSEELYSVSICLHKVWDGAATYCLREDAQPPFLNVGPSDIPFHCKSWVIAVACCAYNMLCKCLFFNVAIDLVLTCMVTPIEIYLEMLLLNTWGTVKPVFIIYPFCYLFAAMWLVGFKVLLGWKPSVRWSMGSQQPDNQEIPTDFFLFDISNHLMKEGNKYNNNPISHRI